MKNLVSILCVQDHHRLVQCTVTSSRFLYLICVAAMNTRSQRSRAKRANINNDDTPIEVIDDSISVYGPKKRRQGPEIITLDEDDIKTRGASIKPEVECIDNDDVITLGDEEDEILCLEEVKTIPAPVTKPAQSKVSAGSEKTGKKENVVILEESSKTITRRQKASRGADASSTSTKTVDSNVSKTVEPVRDENRKKTAQSANKDSSPKEPEGGVLTKKQRSLGPTMESRETSPARRGRDKAKERSEVRTTVESVVPAANKETPKKVTDNSSVKTASVEVKEEPVQPKTELDTSTATFTTWQPLITTVLEPKSEQISDTTTVVVKVQPPEQAVSEENTAVVAEQSRLTAPNDDKHEIDDEEVEGGPEHIRKLFVGRVDRRSTHDSLKRYFERWGRIVDICLPIDRFTKRSRGFAFVTFAKARMVDAVQKARPHTVDGRVVDPKRAVPRWESHLPQARITVKTVFLYNLRGQISEQDLKEYFKTFGKVIRCRIIQQRGIGFVEFDDYDPVDKIFLQKVHHICGKNVGADKAMGKQRVTATRNSWQSFSGRMQNGYGSQRWTGVYPRGSQYSRRFEPYYSDYTWRGYDSLANGYRTDTGGGPVRNYYTQRYSPYSNNYSGQRQSLYSTGYYTQRQSPVSSPATWSSNQPVGYSSGSTDYTSVVVNWSTRRDVSSTVQDSSLWGSRGYSTININHGNTSQASGERDRTFSGLFTFPSSGTFQTYNYSTARR
ncbi:uncharacterized protein [Anabrus simplex]|uniref:uncharacterized protein isoform X2 n=1 Tax=Anabrus simplex TaxID=316456 RepID=UPI0035A312DD